MSLPPLTIFLFGPLRVLVAGAPMPRVRGRSIEWLLALLALRQGRSVDRPWLAATLWPDSTESQALHNLRDALMHLRKALGPEGARIQSPSRQTLILDLTGAEVDVARFDRAIKTGEEAALRIAVELYAGPLLEGCLEEWVGAERASREQACLQAIETLAQRAEQRRDYAEALGLLLRAREMDPFRDTVQRGLMRALAARRDAPAALASYREYRLRLRQEMNIEPDEETAALYRQIRLQAQQAAQGNVSPPQEARPAPTSAPPGQPLPSTLPHPITALIGREQQTREIAEALSRSRLVTLVGAGGVGKTRLAIQVGWDFASEFAQEVAFVALASLSDPALLPSFMATALGIREKASMEPEMRMQALAEWLSTRDVLLVIDNCEHLIEAAAFLAQTLLERCPNLRILTTSRQRLGLTGEVVWRVPPLPVPDVKELPADPVEAAAAARTFPAIQLFVERACAANPQFQMTHWAEVEAVCQICRRLDGTPLAIELAAARVRSLTVEDIRGRLDQRFQLLTGGSRTALPRQQTLRSLIDWSYTLLSDAEKALLCRLSVFSGGWTLEAAETVCAGDPIEEWETLDLLTSLIDKSLVVAETSGTSVRYHLLETVRQYARDRLLESEAEPISRDRHLAFFLALAEEGDTSTGRATQMDLVSRLDAEHDNLRAALEWSLKEKEDRGGSKEGSSLIPPSSSALRLCGALQPFWQTRGYLSEGREWCARCIGAAGSQARASEQAKALNTAGTLANLQGDYASAQAYYEESLSLFREMGDKHGTATSLHGLGNVASNRGDMAAARTYYEEGLSLYREIGDRNGIGAALHNLGNVAKNLGDYASAQAYYEESLSLFREIGNLPFLANALRGLGQIASLQGDMDRARAYYEECLSIQREIGNRGGIANALIHLGNLAHGQSDDFGAQVYYEECLTLYREIGDRSGIGAALHNLGGVAYHLSDYASAQAYYEESLILFREIGHRPFLANALHGLGNVAADQSDFVKARAYHAESLSLRRDMGDRHGIAGCLDASGNMAAKDGRLEQAIVLWGAAEALRAEIGLSLSPEEAARNARAAAAARQTLGEAAFAAAWARGRAMTMEQAIRFALVEASA